MAVHCLTHTRSSDTYIHPTNNRQNKTQNTKRFNVTLICDKTILFEIQIKCKLNAENSDCIEYIMR